MTKPDLTVPPPKPAPELRKRLAALGEWHTEWVRRHVADSEFSPRKRGSDYNLHHLDVDGATPGMEAEFQRRARQIMGIPSAAPPRKVR